MDNVVVTALAGGFSRVLALVADGVAWSFVIGGTIVASRSALSLLTGSYKQGSSSGGGRGPGWSQNPFSGEWVNHNPNAGKRGYGQNPETGQWVKIDRGGV